MFTKLLRIIEDKGWLWIIGEKDPTQ